MKYIADLKSLCAHHPNYAEVTISGVPLADCEAVKTGNTVDIRPCPVEAKPKPKARAAAD